MKRSFYSSFAQDHDNSTTRPQSLPLHLATQASHENSHSIAPHPTQTIPKTAYLLTDGEDGSNEFQSNIWHKPIATSRPWPSILPAYPQGPLAGLGIIFENPPETRRVEQPPSAVSDAFPPLRSPLTSRLAIPETIPEEPVGQEPLHFREPVYEYAYSLCPAVDYAAPSPTPLLSLSPPNFLMMIDFPMVDPITGPLAELARSGLTPETKATLESPVIGFFADINLRAAAARSSSPVPCVNPALVTDLPGDGLSLFVIEDEDIIMDEELAPEVLEAEIAQLVQAEPIPSQPVEFETTKLEAVKLEPGSPVPVRAGAPAALPETTLPIAASPPQVAPRAGTPDLQADFPEDALSAIVNVLADCVKREREQSVAPEAPQLAFPSQTTPAFRAPDYPVQPDFTPIQPLVHVNDPHALIQRLNPPMNAHEGVSISELRAHAEQFRQLNPGCELDRKFFEMFAGRYSANGDPIPEFRCYVTGCNQMNRRRDHILVHVGAHVQHRPFQCEECGMRFLRKNECKRHMTSHTGFKPFACYVCAPHREKSFVRQDLLKRHLKVTHGVTPDVWPDRRSKKFKFDTRQNKENIPPPTIAALPSAPLPPIFASMFAPTM